MVHSRHAGSKGKQLVQTVRSTTSLQVNCSPRLPGRLYTGPSIGSPGHSLPREISPTQGPTVEVEDTELVEVVGCDVVVVVGTELVEVVGWDVVVVVGTELVEVVGWDVVVVVGTELVEVGWDVVVLVTTELVVVGGSPSVPK